MKTEKIIKGMYRISNENQSILITQMYGMWKLNIKQSEIFFTKKDAVNYAIQFLTNNK